MPDRTEHVIAIIRSHLLTQATCSCGWVDHQWKSYDAAVSAGNQHVRTANREATR